MRRHRAWLLLVFAAVLLDATTAVAAPGEARAPSDLCMDDPYAPGCGADDPCLYDPSCGMGDGGYVDPCMTDPYAPGCGMGTGTGTGSDTDICSVDPWAPQCVYPTPDPCMSGGSCGDPCVTNPTDPSCGWETPTVGPQPTTAPVSGNKTTTSTGTPPLDLGFVDAESADVPAGTEGEASDADDPAPDPATVLEVKETLYADATDEELATAVRAHILTETDLLSELGAFTDTPEQFAIIAERYGEADLARFELLDAVAATDDEGRVLLAELVRRQAEMSGDVAVVLAALPRPAVRALEDGESGVVDPEPYLRALSDALYREGRAAGSGRAELPVAEVEALLDSLGLTAEAVTAAQEGETLDLDAGAGEGADADPANAEADPEVAPSAAPPASADGETSSSGPGALVLLAVAAGAVLAAAAVAVALARARRRSDAGPDTGATSGAAATTPASSGGANAASVAASDAPGVTELLDASRRMARSLASDEIAAIAIEEAARLTGAEGGAFLTYDGTRLALATESPGDLVVVDGLGAGSALFRVAETGQPTYAVTHSDPGLATLPVAVAAVPVISGGSVSGVLLVVRSSMQPFDGATVERLGMLAPMAGSALVTARAHESVAELANVDGLTKLHNRRRLDHDLPAALAGRTTVEAAVCFMMIDVDHFKTYNDTHGHTAGDEALQLVAELIRTNVRDGDIVYRYGGEEFSILLPGATTEEAVAVAERVRAAIEVAPFPGEEHQPGGKVTVSMGLAFDADDDDATSLKTRADQALYASKEGGRNRISIAR